jgi:hypothetical protein
MDMRNGIFLGNACHDTSSWKSFVSIYSPLVLHSFKYPFVVLEVFGLKLTWFLSLIGHALFEFIYSDSEIFDRGLILATYIWINMDTK